MDFEGTLHGDEIKLNSPLPYADGTRLTLNVIETRAGPEPETPKRGTAAALLELAGILSAEDADALLDAAMDCRRIDPELWE